MVVAAATGVVLDVAAVVVVAHLNFGASKSINDCVHHLVVDDIYVDTQKIHFLFLVFFVKYVFLKVKGKPAWRTTVSIRNSKLTSSDVSANPSFRSLSPSSGGCFSNVLLCCSPRSFGLRSLLQCIVQIRSVRVEQILNDLLVQVGEEGVDLHDELLLGFDVVGLLHQHLLLPLGLRVRPDLLNRVELTAVNRYLQRHEHSGDLLSGK